MNKRKYGEIKMYDYASEKEFLKHKKTMEKNGWHLIQNGMFKGAFDPVALEDEHFKYSASYLKSDMY